MTRGLFITFEGTEGSGKSTQLDLIGGWLAKKTIRPFRTREPGGTEIGREIRRTLLSEKTVDLAKISEALLYMADRFQHIQEVLKPKLEAGAVVLCDRYHDSTVAYQGYGRKISLELLDHLWRQSGEALDPDLTLLFDVEPKVGLLRSVRKLQKANLDESRFEQEALEFHEQVRRGFLTLAEQNRERIVIIDGNGTIEEVHQLAVSVLQEWLIAKGRL